MSGTLVLIDLAGEVGLLLWGTHMVNTGVQRGYGIALRRIIEHNLGSRPMAFLTGVGITTLLQSSTATGLMAMSFTAAGVLALAPALAIMLGANVGTALVAQALAFNVSILAPPLVLGGVLAFRWSGGSRIKNLGRVAIGLGLMIMALTGLQHTLGPVENTPLLRSLLQSLSGDPLIVVVIALLLTWACHSSVAIVLLVSSLAASHVVGPTETLALVVGANLGGAMPAVMHASSAAARRLPVGNLVARLAGAIVVLPWLPQVSRLLHVVATGEDRLAVDFHLAFNLMLALMFLPFTRRSADLLIRLLPDPPQSADPGRALYLESAALDSTTVALANATRETLRVADMVENMLRQSLNVFRSGECGQVSEIAATERAVGRLGSAIRGYLVAIGSEQTLDDAREGARVQDILSAVINLEHIADIVANNLMEFAVKQQKRGESLSEDAVAAIATLHAELLESQQLAVAVFLRGDQADAKHLLQRKTRLRELEVSATTLVMQQLRDTALANRAGSQEAGPATVDESGLLRVVRDLRRIHSHLASFAYPAVHRPRGAGRSRARSRAATSETPSVTDSDLQAPRR